MVTTLHPFAASSSTICKPVGVTTISLLPRLFVIRRDGRSGRFIAPPLFPVEGLTDPLRHALADLEVTGNPVH